ncbi:ndufa8, NADH-ubiquinone oxidoreductase complex I 19kd subunit [Basidiobolus ranarum]|uniref:NADH-ubiquinone oxidoreductase n=1 Tax=Basidiobolus ranarum TaxID=34480 RepID=A0ABR2WME2_9FUNG
MAAPGNPDLCTISSVEPMSMPAEVPSVPEVGATSAPLTSAAFFIGAYCKDYNEDFMLCKAENNDPKHCLKEGRKVTRCVVDLLKKMKENCGKEFESHYTCLDNNDFEYYACRGQERKLNECVFNKLGLEKNVSGTPEGETPIHLKANPIYR